MFASFDPVAIDLAAADAVNAMPANPRSALSEAECRCHDHFINVHPNTNWRVQIEHGEKIGLGSSESELIRIYPYLTERHFDFCLKGTLR